MLEKVLNSREEITLILIYKKKENMDYQKHYDLLISTRKNMNRNKRKNDGYHNHHIIPKSIGGNNSKHNLVLLTPREHFIAHLLLLMIYKENKNLNSKCYNDYRKMGYAFWNMCGGKNKLKITSSRSYQFAIEIKKGLSVWVIKENLQKFIASYDLEKYVSDGWIQGKLPHTKETKLSISTTKTGLIWINKDNIQKTIEKEDLEKYVTNEWKTGRAVFTENHKNNIKKGLVGRELSCSHKENIGKSLKGKEIGPISDDHKKRLGKPIVIHGIKYDGLTWAAKALSTTKLKIFYKLRDKESIDCYYL